MTSESDGAPDYRGEARRSAAEDAADLRKIIEDHYHAAEVEAGFPHHAAADPDDDSIAGHARRAFDQYDADQAAALNMRDTENAIRAQHGELRKQMGAGAADYTDLTLRGIAAVRTDPRRAAEHFAYHNDAGHREAADAERTAWMDDLVEDYMSIAGVDFHMEEAIGRILASGVVKIDPQDPVGTLRRAHQAALEEIGR
jgi:hypothetical protein